jgi:indole-3-glycerol phosphate synthase
MKAAGTYLEKILARTRLDVEERKRLKAPALLKTLARSAPRPPGFETSLRAAKGARLIAELKRRSPSKGFIDRDLDVTQTARDYTTGGAAALSVLTEGAHFGGSLEDLSRARAGTGLPLLRKDFVLDEYQLSEARVAGASAVLLIVAALEARLLAALLKESRALGLEALVEVHDDAELDAALDAGAAMVGINNRDLRTFSVDLAVTERLAPRAAKAGTLVVAESGISTPDDLRRLASAGADAFLVGESLIRAADRAAATRALVSALA